MKIENKNSPFCGWYDITIPTGKPSVQYGQVVLPPLKTEITDWLRDNIGPMGRGTWVSGTSDKLGKHILIRNGAKAMLFKLTWSA